MLMLDRRVGAKVRIADNIVLTVIRVDGRKVYLGIDAPRDVKVLRGELTSRTAIRTKGK